MYLDDYRQAAVQWSRNLLASDAWVIVDCETTGLSLNAEAIEIAVIWRDPRFSSLPPFEGTYRCRPRGEISRDATEVHGLTTENLVDAPTYEELHPLIHQLFDEKIVIAYNAAYDVRILEQTAHQWSLPSPIQTSDCAMLQYAKYVGEWNRGYRSFRWQKLPRNDPNELHSALGDCRATLEVIRTMAGNS